jgi:hypothetical protein
VQNFYRLFVVSYEKIQNGIRCDRTTDDDETFNSDEIKVQFFESMLQ